VFARAKLNLTNIVCRPIRSQPWAYRFFVEVEAQLEDVSAALLALPGHAQSKILGTYGTVSS
jgi:prephenate dehydratase